MPGSLFASTALATALAASAGIGAASARHLMTQPSAPVYGGGDSGFKTEGPYVIGHRGSPGIYPEHTLRSYEQAILDGADFIECDVVVTKDKKLICRHEPLLSGTTDADDKFPDRITTYTIDGEDFTGVFSTDLTLEEVKMLGAKQSLDFRNPQYDGLFQVPTLEEYIETAQRAGRPVGIYPETKHPTWHDSLPFMEGTTMSDMLLDVLEDYGYGGAVNSDNWLMYPVFIQSFEVGNLKYLKTKTDIPLVQLLGGWEGYVTPDTLQTHEEITTDEGLDDIATYASGVGPYKYTLIPIDENGYLGESTGLTARIQSRGMQVHPYTFRNEAQYLAWDFNSDPFAELYAYVHGENLDGFFTDFAATGSAYLKRMAMGDTALLDPPVLPPPEGADLSGSARKPFSEIKVYNIAHRGDSGVLPEHTREAYRLAIEVGADFIECDVVVTKDKKLICRHEPLLSGTTDADDKFPDKITTYTIDGEEYSGVFSTDLTLEEVKTLRAKQPLDFRNPAFNGEFEVATFEEYVDIALGAGRTVGIYPETKHPTWTDGLDIMQGDTVSDLLLQALEARGYGGAVGSDNWLEQPVFIQSFEVGNLKYLKTKTDIPLVQLLGGWEGYVTPDTNQTHSEITTEQGLDDIAQYASGVGPWKNTLIPVDEESNKLDGPTGLTYRLQKRGLQVHPYTFRAEDSYLAYNFAADIRREYETFLWDEHLDGLFTDQPAIFTDYLKVYEKLEKLY